MGWTNYRYSVLGAPAPGQPIPGIRNQLHAPGLPGAMVSGIGIVSVSMSWWSLLRRWGSRRGTAAARIISIHVQGGERSAVGERRRDADVVKPGLTGDHS